MFVDDIINKGYEVGTFKIGQTIYYVKDKVHRFRFHRECAYCDNKGTVLIKERKFTCPYCKGVFDTKEITELVVADKKEKIRSIIEFKNKNKSREIYTNGSNGYGIIICKRDNGSNRYFRSKKEAQEVCDKYNKENNVYLLIEEYKRKEIRENL